LGYDSKTRGFNYYYLSTHTIIITQGVKFNESNLSSFKYFPTPNIDPFASKFYLNNFALGLSNSFVKPNEMFVINPKQGNEAPMIDLNQNSDSTFMVNLN
jgi:hypothetical protein